MDQGVLRGGSHCGLLDVEGAYYDVDYDMDYDMSHFMTWMMTVL